MPPVLPAYFASGEGQVSMDAVVARSTAAIVLSSVMERRLFRTLRHERGGSYTATASYQARDADHGTITALADTLPENQDVVVGGFIEVLTALESGDIPAADVDLAKAQLRTMLSGPDWEAESVIIAATDLVNRGRWSTVEELIAEADAVTLADVHAVAVEAMGSALLQLPSGQQADWAGFAPVPVFSPAVRGTRYSTHEPSEVALVVGRAGISMIVPEGALTVRFDQCAAMEVWPHGARRLVGTDGVSVPVTPRTLRDRPLGDRDDRRRRAPVSRDLAPALPSWATEAPVRATAEAPPPVRQPGLGWPRTLARAVTWVLFTVWLLFTLYLTVGMLVDDDAPGGVWVVVAMLWFVG